MAFSAEVWKRGALAEQSLLVRIETLGQPIEEGIRSYLVLFGEQGLLSMGAYHKTLAYGHPKTAHAERSSKGEIEAWVRPIRRPPTSPRYVQEKRDSVPLRVKFLFA